MNERLLDLADAELQILNVMLHAILTAPDRAQVLQDQAVRFFGHCVRPLLSDHTNRKWLIFREESRGDPAGAELQESAVPDLQGDELGRAGRGYARWGWGEGEGLQEVGDLERR